MYQVYDTSGTAHNNASQRLDGNPCEMRGAPREGTQNRRKTGERERPPQLLMPYSRLCGSLLHHHALRPFLVSSPSIYRPTAIAIETWPKINAVVIERGSRLNS